MPTLLFAPIRLPCAPRTTPPELTRISPAATSPAAPRRAAAIVRDVIPSGRRDGESYRARPAAALARKEKRALARESAT